MPWGEVSWGDMPWGDVPWGEVLWGIPGGAGDGGWGVQGVEAGLSQGASAHAGVQGCRKTLQCGLCQPCTYPW